MVLNVGDAVQFKDWDELIKEFGSDGMGCPKTPSGFNERMRYLCGQVAHIARFIGDYTFETEERTESTPDRDWILNVAMVKPYEESVPDIDQDSFLKMISFP